MDSFDIAFAYMLHNEVPEKNVDQIVDNPRDPGGITKYGISLRLLRSICLDKLKNYGIYSAEPSDIINLTFEQAKLLYMGEFWEHAPFCKINDQDVVNFMFDMAVNMGISPAIKCTQRACWAVKQDRNAIIDDGILGDETLYLIAECSKFLLPAMRSERAGYYKLVVERNSTQKEFLEGWLNRSYGV